MKKKVALITSETDQNEAYLSELLLLENYKECGIKRRLSLINTQRIDHLFSGSFAQKNDYYIHHGDLKDTNPDKIYNLVESLRTFSSNRSLNCNIKIFFSLFWLNLKKKNLHFYLKKSQFFLATKF